MKNETMKKAVETVTWIAKDHGITLSETEAKKAVKRIAANMRMTVAAAFKHDDFYYEAKAYFTC